MINMNDQFELRDLIYFQRIATLGHVGKAAEQLGYYPEVSADEAIVRATQWFKSEGYIK